MGSVDVVAPQAALRKAARRSVAPTGFLDDADPLPAAARKFVSRRRRSLQAAPPPGPCLYPLTPVSGCNPDLKSDLAEADIQDCDDGIPKETEQVPFGNGFDVESDETFDCVCYGLDAASRSASDDDQDDDTLEELYKFDATKIDQLARGGASLAELTEAVCADMAGSLERVLQVDQAVTSGDGTLQNVGIRVNGAFQCPYCSQRFDSDKQRAMHDRFVHEPMRHQMETSYATECDALVQKAIVAARRQHRRSISQAVANATTGEAPAPDAAEAQGAMVSAAMTPPASPVLAPQDRVQRAASPVFASQDRVQRAIKVALAREDDAMPRPSADRTMSKARSARRLSVAFADGGKTRRMSVP
mmetsp:Transcript_89531/g.252269  ORF Transcript_89531/g.252269 Transcript_89531/m.252269 type:complete len:360 (-) Transcript_89531:223-1302(-)